MRWGKAWVGRRAARSLSLLTCIICIGALNLNAGRANAQAFFSTVSEAVENHDRVVAARADVEAARERIRVSRGAWFPQFEANANYGSEKQLKPKVEDTNTDFHEFDLKITQQLWDFGATNARVEKARLTLLRAELVLYQTRQDIMLEAITAAINVRRAFLVLGFARQANENIRKQTGLEEARVETGGGLSTDVLQSKTQLAGAQARRIQAEGALTLSINRYRSVFKSPPVNIKAIEVLNVSTSRQPRSLSTALSIALKQNPRLRIVSVDEYIARESVREVRGDEFFPRLEVVGEQKFKQDVSGTIGQQNETLLKLQLSFPFNLGFTAVNTLRASQSEVVAASSRVLDTRRQIEESVRNAWQQFETARMTAKSLRDQASLAAAFLGLARKERKLGNRSLIDVLAGETALFNAKSDAASKEADINIAAFTLLFATGQLLRPDTSLEIGNTPRPGRQGLFNRRNRQQ